MARLLWLPEVLRGAGLTVHEVDGWRTRGASTFDPHGIVCHETRGSKTSTDAGEIRVLLEGSATAPPPIAQLYLSRTADWHVVASGRCNHALTGWAGPFKGVGNSGLLGIEAQHALGEPWTARQYDSYVRGVAAIVRHTGWRVIGHKEHQPGPPGPGRTSTKTDPAFDMGKFRRDVAALLDRGLEDDVSAKDVWSYDPNKANDAGAVANAPHRHDYKSNPTVRPAFALGDTWKLTGEIRAEQNAARQREEAILKAVTGASAAEILAEIRRQAEQTRAAVDAQARQLVGELAPDLAQAVAERLGVEIEATVVGEAIAHELAEMLSGGRAAAAAGGTGRE